MSEEHKASIAEKVKLSRQNSLPTEKDLFEPSIKFELSPLVLFI